MSGPRPPSPEDGATRLPLPQSRRVSRRWGSDREALTTMQIRPAVARYGLAVIACGCATGAGIGLQAVVGFRFPLITFYPAVLLSAWFGGLWPGVVATILSTLLVDYVWLAP